jgi:serine carboxypeptidase-like clade 1
MIFLEAPVGVGFSYSDNPNVDYITDDNKTALDNYHFLVEFFKNFPEYKDHDFYVAGESYAGIYVPTLVDTIRVMNQQASDKINLKGFMVGNGCVGNKVGGCGEQTSLKIHVDFFHFHALFPDALYEDMLKECGDFMDPNDKCIGLIEEMSNEIGKVNIYDIYAPCYESMATANRASNPLKDVLLKRFGRYSGPDGCIDDHVERKYFDNSTVREAIHVASMDKIGGWHICTDKINYDANTASLIPLYPTLIRTYRTMIFNGDVDGCVPFIGNEQWTSGLGFKVKEAWRPWMVNDQVAGYVTEYEENDFKFVTVKGSGHMVPQYRPVTAWAMFHRFINNMPL